MMDDSESGTKSLSLKKAYSFAIEHGLQKEVDEIRNMEIEWDLRYTSTLRRGYIATLLEKHNIFDEFKSHYWPEGDTDWGQSKRRFYLKVKKRYEDFLAGRGGAEVELETAEEEMIEESQEFASEADLRDFLAKNLDRIEPGLKLYQSEDRTGVEFPVEGGYIDILAIDASKNFVAIELKLSRGRNKTIGQLLYYMGWIDQNLSKSPCRGMILAKEISNDLITATQRVPGISLYKYHLQVTVEPVQSIKLRSAS
jgi:endonuclease